MLIKIELYKIIIVNKKSSNEFEQFPRKIDKCLDRWTRRWFAGPDSIVRWASRSSCTVWWTRSTCRATRLLEDYCFRLGASLLRCISCQGLVLPLYIQFFIWYYFQFILRLCLLYCYILLWPDILWLFLSDYSLIVLVDMKCLRVYIRVQFFDRLFRKMP